MHRQNNYLEEIIVDNFAGGGGACTGIELATGRYVNIAINHDPDAIAMHKANHPNTTHYQESVWDINPVEVCGGHPVGLAWFSPDCKHFSKAKGGKPVEKNIRGLAWIVLRWAGTVRPRVIILENVEEFKTWGPVRHGKPVKSKTGQTFRRWLTQLRALGYNVDYRELVAADYGAPTIRKRFFLIARCDGKPIVWPEPTHNRDGSSGKKRWRSASEIIDWSLPCPSIFDTREAVRAKYGLNSQRPLADNTMRRIIRGVDKFVIKSAEPFIVSLNHTGAAHDYVNSIEMPLKTSTSKLGFSVVSPSLIQYHAEQSEHVRGQAVTEPVMTIDGSNRYAMTAAHMTEYYGNADSGFPITEPTHTATSKDREGVTVAHLCKFYGTCTGHEAKEPLHTVTQSAGHFGEVRTKLVKWDGRQDLGHWSEIRTLLNKYCGYTLTDDEVLLIEIGSTSWFISDVGLRMLTPRELYNANGFPPDYIIDRDADGRTYHKTKQVARCGNAVPPPFAEALVRANLPEWCGK